MDEYSCKARPCFSLLPTFPSLDSSTYLNKQTISSDDIYFNILLEYTHIHVPTDGKTSSFGTTDRHALRNVSMEQLIMQETTFLPWFSKINFPKDAFRLVFDEILHCANHMVSEDEEGLNVFNIRVYLDVTTPLEDDTCDEGDYKDEQNNVLIEDEEEIEVEEQEEDTDLVPAITRESYEYYYTSEEEMEVEEEEEEEEDNGLVPSRAIEGESYLVDYEDNYGYDGNDELDEDEEEMEVEEEEEDNEVVPSITRASEVEGYEVNYEDSYGYDGLEEDEEEMTFEEEYIRFIPAAKSCIEELEMVEVEEVTKCVICFEDLNAGVQLPCSHIFHANCIYDWLEVGSSCPLCRFQFQTSSTSQ